jgi:undecaprenyl-diphosphatase
VPWLLHRPYARLDPELRKSFEVALHAGTAAALLVALRGEVAEAARELDRRRIGMLLGSFLPPALVGYALERPIERRLGTPGTIAGGLAAGALGMLWVDRRPQTRTREDSRLADALWLGVAQACALVPGVSRNGATLTAARLLCFTRADADTLSRHVALPIIAGATLLKSVRLRARGMPPGMAGPFALGAAAAFASTLAANSVIGRVRPHAALGRPAGDRSLAPYALYRLAVAAAVARRLWRG